MARTRADRSAQLGSCSGTVEETGAEFERDALPYLGRLFSAALYLTGSRADAEDLVHETFVKAFSWFHRLGPETNLRVWLYRILIAVLCSRHRDRRPEPQCSLEEPAADWPRNRTPSPPLPGASAVEARALGQLPDGDVKAALRAIPQPNRIAVYLADVEGFSYKEIAQIIGLPIGTVMSRLHPGRDQLRAELYAKGHDRYLIL